MEYSSEKLRSLTAPCGIDCFNCEAYAENVTPEFQEMFASRAGMKPEEVSCQGCRAQKGDRLGFPHCKTYDCAKRNDVEFCFECSNFPCTRLQPVLEGAERYPHNIKLFNLCRIKSVGVEKWARDEAAIVRERYFKGKFTVGSGPSLSD